MEYKDVNMTVEQTEENDMHCGAKHNSGRFPWVLSEHGELISRVEELKDIGWTEEDIAKAAGISITDLTK